MAKIKLTIRHGAKVRRRTFDSLDEAVAAMRSESDEIRAEGGLPAITAFRTYGPSDRVHARLEISTGGPLRGRDAGVDLMGDGGIVPFRGGISRKPLEPSSGGDAFDVVEETLRA